MAERSHPEDLGLKDGWFGLKKNKYKKYLIERYRFCNRYVKNKKVLEVPCGVGWGTSMLEGVNQIFAVDISEEAIDYAKKNFTRKHIIYETGDMARLNYNDNFFDIVLCVEGFEHVPKAIGTIFLHEAKRVLKEDGLLLITVPLITKGCHSGNPYHLNEPTLAELQEMLMNDYLYKYFEIIQGPDSDVAWFVGTPK